MMNKSFTGWQWLLIDAANQMGKDKLTFEERIQWTEAHLDQLEALAPEAGDKERPLYHKAVMAIRKAQKGLPTGHMVAVDATCSGIQIMSVLTGCESGADATGLIDPDRRADAYSSITDEMNNVLGSGTVQVPRKDAKAATMTSFYGSKATPKEIFGEDTPELNAFYQAAYTVAPGAWELLQDLLGSWNQWALQHAWKMPDGYDVVVRVMDKKEARIEVDELDHATFTYEFYENQGTKRGLSNAANCVHSVDAWILRSMHRRCNYDLAMVKEAERVIEIELIKRSLGGFQNMAKAPGKVGYYLDQYYRSTVADVVILPFLNEATTEYLDQQHLGMLMTIIQGMLKYKPFPLVTVHDAFAAHANNVNWVRWQYREILAELAESNLIDDLLSQIYGMPGHFDKLTTDLGDKIRNSEYALC